MIYISNGDNMKKTSITKKRKKMKLLFTFSMLILGIIASYKTLDNKKIVINDKELTNLIINDSFNNNEVNFIKEIVSDIASVTNPIKLCLLCRSYNISNYFYLIFLLCLHLLLLFYSYFY